MTRIFILIFFTSIQFSMFKSCKEGGFFEEQLKREKTHTNCQNIDQIVKICSKHGIYESVGDFFLYFLKWFITFVGVKRHVMIFYDITRSNVLLLPLPGPGIPRLGTQIGYPTRAPIYTLIWYSNALLASYFGLMISYHPHEIAWYALKD